MQVKLDTYSMLLTSIFNELASVTVESL